MSATTETASPGLISTVVEDAPAQRRAAPVTDGDRIRTVDMLRGVALCGILLMNIPYFALADYAKESFNTNVHSGNFWLMAVIGTLFEGKMRALFGMLFGAGTLLFIGNKEGGGRSVTWLYYRRMLVLVAFGLIHAHVILWAGEILYFYGICGMIIYLFRKLKPRHLMLGVPLVALLDFGAGVLQHRHFRNARLAYVAAADARAHGAQLDASQTAALAAWDKIEHSLIPNRTVAAENTAKVKSGYRGAASVFRKQAWQIETIFLPLVLPDSVALMLLGMALFKLGYFSGTWKKRTYRRIMLVGYGLGLPLVTFAFLYHVRTTPTLEAGLHHLETTPVPWVDLIYPFQRMLLVLAHSSALVLLWQAGVAAWLMKRLAAVGQMALSNYVGHSIICTLTFFGYGLNQYAEWQYWQLYVFVAGVWAFQLAVSPWWLARFRFGPFEWAWRMLTYGELPPMRRTQPA
jgi:uncharacterized protein